VVGDRIYVGGGFEDLTAFNAYLPETDEWVNLAPMPGGRHHYGITPYDGNVYVFAGAHTTTAWRYNVATNDWTNLAPMLFERSSGMAVTLGDYMYFVGGAGAVPTATQRYSPAANKWGLVAEISTLRDHSGAVVLDEKIYSMGGRGGGKFLNTVEIYDPALDKWTPGPSMIHARSGFGTVVWKGYIVACGGEVRVDPNNTPVALDTCEALPPGAAEWKEWPKLPHGTHGTAMASYKDRIFILGGSLEGFAITPTTDTFELVFE
jgi:N-acetylneuraminic acid mutarotase